MNSTDGTTRPRRGPFCQRSGVLALAGLLATCACRFSAVLSVELVTQDRASGVPCQVGVWRGAIGPIDGQGTPIATTVIRSGGPVTAELDFETDRLFEPRLYWVSFVCEGYLPRVRAVEIGPLDALWQPLIDLGRVWVPKKRPAGIDAEGRRR